MKVFKPFVFVLMFVLIGTVSFAQSGVNELVFENADLELVNKVDIYPNPTVDFVNVTITNSNLKNPKIKLFNIIGNEITVKVELQAEGHYKLDVADIKPGYYLLSIEDSNTQFKELHKFLKR